MIRKLLLGLFLVVCGAIAAIATISSSLNSIIVNGTGAQTVFTFPFVGVAASDISVVYTDTTGAQTTLVQGPGTTQYQVALNAAVAPNLWGVGGTVTYNPSGTPIASGTTLTIVRTLPYLQLTSLQNQASFGQLASATEMALDQLEMQIQQISNGFRLALVAPPSDPPGIIYTLPSVAARANTVLGFDSLGDVIAAVAPSSGVISSAMQPVVNAASLAAGRTAFGLNSAATGIVNYGLQQGVSGTNNIDVNQAAVQDATNQAVTAAFQMTRHICTGPINYTLPRANTTWAGFGFWVYAATGTCTITPNAADNFLGLGGGVAVAVPPNGWVYVTTSATSTGVWWADYHGPSNANLVAGAAGSALTLTLYSGPLQFRDTTLANGDPVWSLPANGIAITVPSTATLGTSSNVPFRVWIYAAYNSGTPILGVAVCSIATAIYPCAAWETLRKTGTLISTGATSAGVLYTSAASSNDSVIIVGYADFCVNASCTAGTWVAPTTVQLCLPPRQCKRPGDIVQTVTNTTTTTGTTTSNSLVALTTGQSLSITPTASPNLVRVTTVGTVGNATNSNNALQLQRGSTLIGVLYKATITGTWESVMSTVVLDAPGVATSTTYSFQGATSAGTLKYPDTSLGAFMEIEEIMGALDPPANDNGIGQESKVG